MVKLFSNYFLLLFFKAFCLRNSRMRVRIYQPTKTAMQSGRAAMKAWVMEFEQNSGRFVEPIMGWTGSNDTRQQLKLRFSTKEDALTYAKKHSYEVDVEEPNQIIVRPKSYADNFLK
jgi:imidazoleglycerol phosphate synthase glutamine amidotransferase subunit HisH